MCCWGQADSVEESSRRLDIKLNLKLVKKSTGESFVHAAETTNGNTGSTTSTSSASDEGAEVFTTNL
jgi:hypothetical protein